MTDQYQIRVGAEDLQWLIFQSLFNELNAAIDEEETRGYTLDDAFNTLTGRTLRRVKLDRIRPENFHLGHRPSLIEAPPSEWPAVTVMAFNSTGAGFPGTDRSDENVITVSIKCIAHAGPFEITGSGIVALSDDKDPEEEVDRKIKRPSEALHKAVARHRDLDGNFTPTENPPSIIWGDVFIKDVEIGQGVAGRYYWQGVRMQYTFLSSSFHDILDQNII